MKKAAVIGAVAYGSYQLGKLSAGFDNYGWGHQHGYSFDTWNRDREADGMLCRNTKDCNWIDDKYRFFIFSDLHLIKVKLVICLSFIDIFDLQNVLPGL